MRCERCDGELYGVLLLPVVLGATTPESRRTLPWSSADREAARGFAGVAVPCRPTAYPVSIWNDERAVAAIAFEEREADRLASFLALGEPRGRHRFRDEVRVSAIALRRELSRR